MLNLGLFLYKERRSLSANSCYQRSIAASIAIHSKCNGKFLQRLAALRLFSFDIEYDKASRLAMRRCHRKICANTFDLPEIWKQRLGKSPYKQTGTDVCYSMLKLAGLTFVRRLRGRVEQTSYNMGIGLRRRSRATSALYRPPIHLPNLFRER